MPISQELWKGLVFLTGVVLFGFLSAVFLEGTAVGVGGRVFFGLALFFLLGTHLALIENIIFQVRDHFFVVTLGIFNALFIIPVFYFIIFSFVQNVSEYGIILTSGVLALVLLVIQYKYRHEIVAL